MAQTANAWTSVDADFILPAHRADVAEHVIDGEAVLADPASGAAHRLNTTALSIWRQCDGQRTVHDIAGCHVETFDVEFDAALAHIEETVTLLSEAGVLVLTADG